MTSVAARPVESRWLRAAGLLLALTVAGLPLYVVRWSYGPLPTTLLETLVELTVVVYVVARWRDGWRRPVSTPYDALVVLLLLAGAISVLVAHDHRGALGLYKAYFIEPVALFYIAADLLRSQGRLRLLLAGFAVGSVVLALLNLAAFAHALSIHQFDVNLAPAAVYENPNQVAMYLEPPVAFAAGLVLFSRLPLERALAAVWLLIAALALALTFSKGSYLAVGVLAVIAVLTVRRRLPLLALLVVGAGALALVPAVLRRFSSTGTSILLRTEIYSAAFAMLRQHPVLGLGITGFRYRLHATSIEIYPHDVFLAFWVETGVLGLVAFAVLLFALLWHGWRAWPRLAGLHRAAAWGALGSLAMIAVHGVVDTPYWKNDLSVEFWIAAAIQVASLAVLGERRPALGVELVRGIIGRAAPACRSGTPP